MAASLLASMAIFNFIGATGSGYLSDRVDCRILLCVYYGLRGLSLLFLPFSFDTFYTLSLFAMFYGLDWIATIPPTVKLIGQSFGREKTAVMYGWITCCHQLGGASAAFFGGVLRVNFDTYMHAFMISGLHVPDRGDHGAVHRLQSPGAGAAGGRCGVAHVSSRERRGVLQSHRSSK